MGEMIYPSKYVKYLGILIDHDLNCYHIDLLVPKLSRAIGILSKIRHFVTIDNLRNIYFGIFSSKLTHGADICGQQHNSHLKRIIKL